MLEQLINYHHKLKKFPQVETRTLEDMRKDYLAKIEKQLDKRLNQHWHDYCLRKRSLLQEQNSVDYYRKLAEKVKQFNADDGDGNAIDKQEAMREYSESLSKTNLYSLFKTIDDKAVFNVSMITDFRFTFSLPSNQKFQDLDMQLERASILRQNVKELENFMLSSPNYEKLSKKQVSEFKQIQEKYAKFYQNLQTSKTNLQDKLKVKDTLGCVLSNLACFSYLQQIDLSIVTNQGLMCVEQYEKLCSVIFRNRFFTKSIKLKLMDMEFCQQKCDVLKRYLKKMNTLSSLTIHNYYGECKLGLFEDFNWHPYRKKINIKSGVWK